MKDPLLSLAPAELRALATSVRKGRVSAPYSALSVQQIVGQHAAVSASSKLDLLSSSGMSPEAVSVCLKLTADALSSRSPLEDLVDLVTTGPEAGGVANRSTAVVVSELFRAAEHFVLIAGYAVYQGQRVFQSLGDRMVQCPELDVRVFLGDVSVDFEPPAVVSGRHADLLMERQYASARRLRPSARDAPSTSSTSSGTQPSLFHS